MVDTGRVDAGRLAHDGAADLASGASRDAGAVRAGLSEALDDLARALLAYDRMARSLLEDQKAPVLEVRLTALPLTAAHAVEAPAAGVEAAVVGLDAGAGAQAEPLVRTCGELVRPGGLVYACILEPTGTDAVRGQADVLEALCADSGLTWAGGLVVPANALVPGLLAHPRMGALRRPLSEAADDLVAAVRAGLTVAEAARLFSWPAQGMLEGRDDLLAVRQTVRGQLLAMLARRQARYLRSR